MSVLDLFFQRAFDAGANASLLATILLGLVWLWLRLARNSSASFRALVWTVALTVTLALPAALAVASIVSRTAPSGDAPSAVVTATAVRVEAAPLALANEPTAPVMPVAHWAPRLEWQAAVGPQLCRLVVAVWLAGAGLVLGRFILGNVLLSWRRRRADLSQLSAWREAADYALRQLGVGEAMRLVPDASTSTPTVWAGRVPTVFLPLVTDWSDERKRVVLLHEFAHIKRGDPQALWLKQLAAALYWFHPVVLFGLKESNVACEQACDDMVLNAGVRSTDYATHLLEISAELPEPACPQAVMSILGTQSLERRVTSILGASVPRGAPHPLIWAVAGMAAVPVAMALVAARPFEPNFQTSSRAVPPPVVARAAMQSAAVSENSARTLESPTTPAAAVNPPMSLAAPAVATLHPVPETPVNPPADSSSPAIANDTPVSAASSDGTSDSRASAGSNLVETPTAPAVTATTSATATAVVTPEPDLNAPRQAEPPLAAAASTVAVTPPPLADAPPAPAVPASYVLSAGTKIWLIHTANLTSATATQGETVELMLAKDLKVGDAIVVKAGTPARGTVTHVKKAKVPARRGEIELRLDYLRAGDRTVKLQTEPDGSSAVVQYRSPYSLKWPLGVLGPGYEANVPAGTGVIAYIAENVAFPAQP